MAIYMKYGGLKGEVTSKGYEGWIELSSMQWGCGRGISMTSGGGGSTRESSAPSFSEVTVTKEMCAASPLLLKEFIGGPAAEVKLDITRTDGKGQHVAFQKFILGSTQLSGYSQSTSGDRPSESLSLNYTKIDSEYIKVDDKFKPETTGHVIYDLSKAMSG